MQVDKIKEENTKLLYENSALRKLVIELCTLITKKDEKLKKIGEILNG